MDSLGITTTIDFREKAPLKASPEMFIDEAGRLPMGTNHIGIQTTSNHIWAKSIGVPGTVAGLYLAH
jgi:gamma-glutamyltranspeptidase/glutathione hydrolase